MKESDDDLRTVDVERAADRPSVRLDPSLLLTPEQRKQAREEQRADSADRESLYKKVRDASAAAIFPQRLYQSEREQRRGAVVSTGIVTHAPFNVNQRETLACDAAKWYVSYWEATACRNGCVRALDDLRFQIMVLHIEAWRAHPEASIIADVLDRLQHLVEYAERKADAESTDLRAPAHSAASTSLPDVEEIIALSAGEVHPAFTVLAAVVCGDRKFNNGVDLHDALAETAASMGVTRKDGKPIAGASVDKAAFVRLGEKLFGPSYSEMYPGILKREQYVKDVISLVSGKKTC